jgi:hypothetical protein
LKPLLQRLGLVLIARDRLDQLGPCHAEESDQCQHHGNQEQGAQRDGQAFRYLSATQPIECRQDGHRQQGGEQNAVEHRCCGADAGRDDDEGGGGDEGAVPSVGLTEEAGGIRHGYQTSQVDGRTGGPRRASAVLNKACHPERSEEPALSLRRDLSNTRGIPSLPPFLASTLDFEVKH